MLKVASIDEAIVTVTLVEVTVDVGVALGLPGAYLDTRQVGVVEIDHQEEVASVGIRRGVVVLMDMDAVGILADTHFLHIVVGEADVDKLVALKATLHILDILLLAVTGVLHDLIVEILLILCCLLGFADDMAHDDDGIVVEDTLDIVGTLQSEAVL